MKHYIDPNDPANPRRAILLLDLAAATMELPHEQARAFDLVAMGGRTITEAAAEMGVPRSTCMDWYNSALAGVRRRIKNDPVVGLLFDALKDLFDDRR